MSVYVPKSSFFSKKTVHCGGSECDGVSVADIVVVGGGGVVIAGVMLLVGGFFRVVVVIWA